MDLSVPQHVDQDSATLYTIEALVDTYLKKEPIQASSLPETEKVRVSAGKTYSIVWKGYRESIPILSIFSGSSIFRSIHFWPLVKLTVRNTIFRVMGRDFPLTISTTILR